jgi:hypothetical protein
MLDRLMAERPEVYFKAMVELAQAVRSANRTSSTSGAFARKHCTV